MSVLINADQLRQATFGVELTKGPSVVPTSTGNLYAVSVGPIRITGVVAVVTTAFTATATTLNMGTAAGATTLFSAATLTSLTVGTVLVGTPTPASPVVAATGNITWIASASNTGQLQVFLSYIPVIPGAGAT